MTEFSFLDEISLEKAEMNGKLNHYERIKAYYSHIAPTVYVHLLAIKRSDCFLFFILSKSFVGFCLLDSSVEITSHIHLKKI